MTEEAKPDTTQLLQQALEAERVKNEQLAQANAALISEFSTAGTYAEQLEVAKKAIKDILPEAIKTVNEIIVNGESEGVRANLSKWVLDSVLSGKLDKSTDGEVADMLRKLAENGDNVPQRMMNDG